MDVGLGKDSKRMKVREVVRTFCFIFILFHLFLSLPSCTLVNHFTPSYSSCDSVHLSPIIYYPCLLTFLLDERETYDHPLRLRDRRLPVIAGSLRIVNISFIIS